MKNANVTRICINPQSLNEKTLVEIGRSHTVQEFYTCYEHARKYDFIINVDLIAGFVNESFDDFKYSIDGILNLQPENITIHTLSKKRGALLINSDQENNQINCMLDYSQSMLNKADYLPYYLYRQKQMAGGLENVGYTKPGYVCTNNVTSMEECLSVIACGAGAISKTIDHKNNRIERHANLRDIRLYLEQEKQRYEIKEEFFKKQFTSG